VSPQVGGVNFPHFPESVQAGSRGVLHPGRGYRRHGEDRRGAEGAATPRPPFPLVLKVPHGTLARKVLDAPAGCGGGTRARRPPGSSRVGRPGRAPGADAAPKGRLSPLRSPRGRPCAPPRRKNGHATAGGSGALADARAGGCEERPAALNGRRPGLSPPAPQVKTGVVLACEACVRQHTIFSIPQGLLRCLGNIGGVWLRDFFISRRDHAGPQVPLAALPAHPRGGPCLPPPRLLPSGSWGPI